MNFDFTQHEINILTNQGYFFSDDDDREFVNMHDNSDYETIIKNDNDNFDYYFDISVDASDLEKANRNITALNLTWEELLKAIDFSGFC